METFHAKRLLKLADFLEAQVPRARFNIGRWGDKTECVVGGEHTCQTVACAGGWAGTIPAFRRAGFRLGFDEDGDGTVTFYPTLNRDVEYSGPHPSDGEDACHRFFGTSSHLNLFHPWGYEQGMKVTPKQVAKRFRQVVRQKYPEVYKAYRAEKRLAA